LHATSGFFSGIGVFGSHARDLFWERAASKGERAAMTEGALSIRKQIPEIPGEVQMERTFSGISFRSFRCTSRACPNIPENRNDRKIFVPFVIWNTRNFTAEFLVEFHFHPGKLPGLRGGFNFTGSLKFDRSLSIKPRNQLEINMGNKGRFPFDQKFRDFRSETKWNGKKSGRSFRKFRIRFECTLFVGISGIIENFVFHS